MRVEHEGFIVRTTRVAWRLVVALAVSGSSGCAIFQGIDNYLTYNDATNDFVLGWRNSVWARQAWHERKSQFIGQPQYSHFGAGFRAGYENVASGGNGCPPGIAPREFWTWKYQTPEGQAQVAAWFAGFPYGAKAAEEDGAGLYQQIQVSHAIERQYSPEFQYSLGSPDDVPVTPAYPGAGEPMPAPIPRTQDPPPIFNPQTRVLPGFPNYASTPAASAGHLPSTLASIPNGVAPAAYYESATTAVATPNLAPAAVRTPAATPIPEFQANPWAMTR